MATSLISEKKSRFNRDKINNQQWSFIHHLLADKSFDITRAARAAGYKCPAQSGTRLMHNKKIAHEVGNVVRERRERLQWSGDDIVRLLNRIIEVDITQLYDADGYISIETVKGLPASTRQLISKVTVKHRIVENEVTGDSDSVAFVEIEWMSKDNALGLAMRHFGLMTPELQLNIVGDDVKKQVITEMLHQMEAGAATHVIDATAVKRLAMESD